ncbi:hypothetical protein EYF80_037638 [Liparis tanakae]|uniref:Uncharacterized protein n=1 Tax=Liparis tanakae TaxID=230148 RepID=A0A4Z2GF51_9TELE|nr:hypothetical protein EYF80_037638 [Liparis tanakae]
MAVNVSTESRRLKANAADVNGNRFLRACRPLPYRLDSLTAPVFPDYRAGRGGPGCPSVLHLAGLRVEGKLVLKMADYIKPVINKHALKQLGLPEGDRRHVYKKGEEYEKRHTDVMTRLTSAVPSSWLEVGEGDPVALHMGVFQLPRRLHAPGGLVTQQKVPHRLTCHCDTPSTTTMTLQKDEDFSSSAILHEVLHCAPTGAEYQLEAQRYDTFIKAPVKHGSVGSGMESIAVLLG